MGRSLGYRVVGSVFSRRARCLSDDLCDFYPVFQYFRTQITILQTTDNPSYYSERESGSLLRPMMKVERRLQEHEPPERDEGENKIRGVSVSGGDGGWSGDLDWGSGRGGRGCERGIEVVADGREKIRERGGDGREEEEGSVDEEEGVA